MAKIYLVRHGESVANTQGIYQGITYNTPLSALGEMQAIALAVRLTEFDLIHIFASPLIRTKQTAEAVARVKGLQVETVVDIIETNHGLWEGKHKDDIAKTWSDLYKKWLKFPSSVTFLEGEKFVETQKRVLSWWERFKETAEGDILVVTHDNIIRIIVAKVLRMKLNRVWRFHVHPTALTIINVDNGEAKVEVLNEVSHLDEISMNLRSHAL